MDNCPQGDKKRLQKGPSLNEIIVSIYFREMAITYSIIPPIISLS